MLQEVSSSIGLVSLSSASGIDPYTDGRGLSPWRVFGSNLEGQSACLFHLSHLSHLSYHPQLDPDSPLSHWTVSLTASCQRLEMQNLACCAGQPAARCESAPPGGN